MPKLVVFAACEKVIISQDENNPTLVALLTDVGAELEIIGNSKEGGKKPMVPMRWSVFSLWRVEHGDEGKTFEQTVRPFRQVQTSRPWVITSPVGPSWEKLDRMTLQIPGVPANKPGDWTLQCFVRLAGQNGPLEPAATYTLTLHVVVKTLSEARTSEISSDGRPRAGTYGPQSKLSNSITRRRRRNDPVRRAGPAPVVGEAVRVGMSGVEIEGAYQRCRCRAACEGEGDTATSRHGPTRSSAQFRWSPETRLERDSIQNLGDLPASTHPPAPSSTARTEANDSRIIDVFGAGRRS